MYGEGIPIMNFQSLQFLGFIIITFIFYWGTKDKYRWVILMVANTYYYANFGIKYVLLLYTIIGLSYLAGIMLEREKDIFKKKCILTFTIIGCLFFLFIFKYYDFTLGSVSRLLGVFSISYSPPLLGAVLPVGISFYTFMALSYVIDIYQGKSNSESHFGKYAAYVSFFPQILAGPISRAKDLLPQMNKEKHFVYKGGL